MKQKSEQIDLPAENFIEYKYPSFFSTIWSEIKLPSL